MRLCIVIAAKHSLNLFKSDTKLAFLNGDIWDEKKYVRPPDWWPEHVPHEYAAYALELTKSMYCTLQAARQ